MKRFISMVLVCVMAVCLLFTGCEYSKDAKLYLAEVEHTLDSHADILTYEIQVEKRDVSVDWYDIKIKIVPNETLSYEGIYEVISEVEAVPTMTDEYFMAFAYAEYYVYGIEYSIENSYILLKDGKEVYSALGDVYDDHRISGAEARIIIKWIREKYSYYDSMHGGYSGDKYSDTIFNQAAEHFGVPVQEIEILWMNAYDYE